MENQNSTKVKSIPLPLFEKLKMLYLKSIKPIPSEEIASLIFMRPLGFIAAMIGKVMRLTPNMLTVFKGLLALWSGVLFFQGTSESVFWGAIILIISNIYDSADGQLARILDRHTKLGALLDGIGDWVAIGAVYSGSAFVLYNQNPQTGSYWWIVCFFAFLCFIVHIYVQGFLKYEFYLYLTEEIAEGLKAARIVSDSGNKTDTGEKKQKSMSFRFIKFFNAAIDAASNLVLIKKYKGYDKWYNSANKIPSQKKAIFKANYKDKNGLLLILFNNLGMLSNQLIFIICGLFNRFDIAIYIILLGSNLYFLVLIFIQRMSFSRQIDNLKLEE